jgi:hypothetical protein
MDDMMELTGGNAILWRRLEAYAESRLSPDVTTSSRLRARVLAVAHRQAALAHADAGLTIVPTLDDGAADAAPFSPRAQQLARAASGSRGWSGRRSPARRAAAVALAATLGLGVMAGGAFAARPGGPLYDARLFAETLTLPSDPSARAVAELDRLKDRLREIAEASRAGDSAGVTAAVAAYEAIVDEASASAILAGDDVAAAVLETGVARNVAVLQALVARVPANASAAISRALDAAIARSTQAVERIHASRGAGGPHDDGASGPPPAQPSPRATKAPTAAPASTATPKPKPTHKATAVPTVTPERTPKPRDDQVAPDPPDPLDPPDPTKQPKPGQDGRGTQRDQGDQGG